MMTLFKHVEWVCFYYGGTTISHKQVQQIYDKTQISFVNLVVFRR